MTTPKEGKGRGVPPGAGPCFETVAALMEQLDELFAEVDGGPGS